MSEEIKFSVIFPQHCKALKSSEIIFFSGSSLFLLPILLWVQDLQIRQGLISARWAYKKQGCSRCKPPFISLTKLYYPDQISISKCACARFCENTLCHKISAETALMVSFSHAGLSQILSFASCWPQKKLETAASAVQTADSLLGISQENAHTWSIKCSGRTKPSHVFNYSLKIMY